jgi:hypothetical protein
MEGQAFFNTVAGLSVSLAGFASLIAWLRDDATTWDPINLWRVKTIVRHALTIAAMALVLSPIYSMFGDMPTTVRIGSVLLALFEVADMLKSRHPDPAIWQPAYTWKIAMTSSLVYAALQVANFWLGSLAVLQLGYLLMLGSPAGIFYNFVRELGGARQAAALGTDADRHEGDG